MGILYAAEDKRPKPHHSELEGQNILEDALRCVWSMLNPGSDSPTPELGRELLVLFHGRYTYDGHGPLRAPKKVHGNWR